MKDMAIDLKAVTKGSLFKWTNYVHGWQQRYFILKNGILMYHKSEEETSYGCRGAIAVKASTLTLHEFDCCRFDVGVCDYVWYLRAETKDERNKWIRALQEQAYIFSKEESQRENFGNNNHTTAHNNNLDNASVDDTATKTNNNITSINDNHDECSSRASQQEASQILPQPLKSNLQLQEQQQYSDNFCDAQETFEDPDPNPNNSIPQANETVNKMNTPNNPMWPKIDQTTQDQVGLGQQGTMDGWQLFAEDGQMRLYTRELEIDGLVCDPLKAVHVVRGVTGFEMCHRFFSPNTRFEWEQTLESMKVVEEINKETLVFHQIHKRIWPAAQRDAVFWSHIRKVDDPKPSCLSQDDDINPKTRPDLKLHDVWIVCNNSTDKPEIPLDSCVRVRLTVSLICETYIPVEANAQTVTRQQIICKIIYSSTINPGGWAPASILRAVYKREYPKFLDNFSRYVISSVKSKPIVFE